MTVEELNKLISEVYTKKYPETYNYPNRYPPEQIAVLHYIKDLRKAMK